jgi:predicted dehydrogenase
MASSPYRAAIIGTGRIATLLERDPLRVKPHTHAGHYRANPETILIAGSDSDEERLALFAEDWGIAAEHLYGDYLHMLSEERPEIVSVCAYAPDRLAMCRAALEAGARGLWIEKALACSVEDAREIERLVRAHGAQAVVDHPRRAEARYRAVARWIRDGTFGSLETVHVLFSGHIVHTGTHAWDLLLDWCGPWARVDAALDPVQGGLVDGREARRSSASTVQPDEQEGVHDCGGRARIVFANGIETFVSGGGKGYFVFQFDLVFSHGRVRIGNDVWDVALPRPSPRYSGFLELESVDPAACMRPDDQYATPMLADLILAMQDGRVPLQSVGTAVAALELGIAIVQAGRSGGAVTPATVDATLRVASL